MKFLPTLKAAKFTLLAAVTVTTAIVSNMAPSRAEAPQTIYLAPNRPAIAVFGDRSSLPFAIGCPALDRLWGRVTHTNISTQQFDTTFGDKRRRLEHMHCGQHPYVRAFVSTAFGPMTGYRAEGLLVLDRRAYFVSSREFFTAMGITPITLFGTDAQSTLDEYASFGNPFKSVFLSPRK